jgi:hypothetical protein
MSYRPAYEHTTWHGKTVSARSKFILEQIEKKLGFDLYCFQGSFSTAVQQSGNTHAESGAVDVSICPAGSSTAKADLIVKTFREFGWAAWHRTPDQGNWGHHVHAVDSGDQHLSDAAQRQVTEYRQGYNGLVGDGRDDGPRITLVARQYPPLPYVSLANVQAQAEKGGPRVLRGVRRVQRALNAHGADLVVDGHFGAKTKKAYAKFELQFGGNGDGIPGLFSLTKLGEGRFKVRKS